MDNSIITRFEAARPTLRKALEAEHPTTYGDLVHELVKALEAVEGGPKPDPQRITTIDHGDYQGTLVYVIGNTGYQPSCYWATYVSYGSCSGCDTIQCIQEDGYDGPPGPSQVDDYMTLALHLVQNMKCITH